MHNFFPSQAFQKMQLQQWANLRQPQVGEAIRITKDSLIGFLARQMEKGHWHEVKEILNGKPMTNAGKEVYEQLSSHVVSNLMLQLKLRKAIALGLVVVLLPLAIAKFGGAIVRLINQKE